MSVLSLVSYFLQLRSGRTIACWQPRRGTVLDSDIADTIMAPHVLEATHEYATDENVSPAERSAILMVALKVLELWEWQYGEYVEGMLQRDSLPVDSWRLWYFGKAQSPLPLQEIWELRKDVLSPAFVRFFEESVIDRGPS